MIFINSFWESSQHFLEQPPAPVEQSKEVQEMLNSLKETMDQEGMAAIYALAGCDIVSINYQCSKFLDPHIRKIFFLCPVVIHN